MLYSDRGHFSLQNGRVPRTTFSALRADFGIRAVAHDSGGPANGRPALDRHQASIIVRPQQPTECEEVAHHRQYRLVGI